MNFDIKKTLLYSDTTISDIFISDYLPNLDGNSLKVYIYCAFLAKDKKSIEFCDLAKKLGIAENKIREYLNNLQSFGLIIQGENSVVFNDLKERTVLANYKLRQSSDPDKCLLSAINKKRNKVIKSINNKFFQGVMSPSWYTDIDSWFEEFRFEDDAMYMLFQHCHDRGTLQRNYVLKVAQTWHNKGITTSLDVENYYEEYQRMKNVGYKIKKKMNRKTPFTEYDDKLVEKWIFEYKYDFDIIDIALQKTTGTFNPSLNYIDSILKSWYEAGLKTKDEILSHSNSFKEKYKNKSKKSSTDSFVAYKDFDQRKYSDSQFESFYRRFDNNSK